MCPVRKPVILLPGFYGLRHHKGLAFFFFSYLRYLCQKEFAKEPNLFMASQLMKNAGSLDANYWLHGNIYHKS